MLLSSRKEAIAPLFSSSLNFLESYFSGSTPLPTLQSSPLLAIANRLLLYIVPNLFPAACPAWPAWPALVAVFFFFFHLSSSQSRYYSYWPLVVAWICFVFFVFFFQGPSCIKWWTSFLNCFSCVRGCVRVGTAVGGCGYYSKYVLLGDTRKELSWSTCVIHVDFDLFSVWSLAVVQQQLT